MEEKSYMLPVRQMLRNLRTDHNKIKLADSNGLEMNGKTVLLTGLALRQLLKRLLRRDEKNIGVLMPTSVYGALANVALALCGKTSVNLNYTFNSDTLNFCIDTAEIKHVITSRKFLEKYPNLELNADLLVLEDIRKQITLTDKIIAKAQSLLPSVLLERLLGLTKISSNDLLTIIFTSGSTGKPKGAMLTHNNIAANVFAFCERLHVNISDRILGILPFFHSFGFTTTLWLPLTVECSVAYHFNPLEPKKVGEVSAKYGCTTMPSTPTFQKSYLRRCPKKQFEKMHTIVCGAEKLPPELTKEWEAKFGQKLVEGYGTTELSPVVSTCAPLTRFPNSDKFYREGSIGKPLVNVKVKIVDSESGKEQPVNTPGMLLIKGPAVMKGYYRNPELTVDVFKGGWYVTGDIARQDEDGFLFITGRLSRISKIAGEMVPHILIEETIDKILARQRNPEQEADGLQIVVTAVPDEKKGERIVVLYRNLAIPPEEIREAMMTEGVPNLWIPSIQSFRQVENIPILGTGKLDLAEIKKMAERLFT